MKAFLISLFFLFFCGIGNQGFQSFGSQSFESTDCQTVESQAVGIDWYISEDTATTDEWTFAEAVYPNDSSLPYYVETLYPMEDIAEMVIRYPIYTEIKGKALQQMLPKLRSLPDTLKLDLSRGMERKKVCWDVSFCPFIRKQGRYYRLISFEWAFQPSGSCVWKESVPLSEDYTRLRSADAVLNDPSRYADSSKLATGQWTKISVTETGMYKLTYEAIRGMGIDPAKVQIYGYGGYLLPEDFSGTYVDDLPEVSIYKNEADGYILFYAQATYYWVYDSSYDIYTRVNNHYTTKGYYFVGERAAGSKLATVADYSHLASTTQTDTYTDFMLYENDLYNLGATGRECYGEDFSTAINRSFSFDLSDNVKTDESSRVMVEFVARSTVSTYCYLYLNSTYAGQMSFSSISADNSYTYARSARLARNFTTSGPAFEVSLQYKNNNVTPKAAHLNYMVLNVRKALNLSSPVLMFQDPKTVGAGNVVSYELTGTDENTQIFDVTSPAEMSLIGAAGSQSFLCPADELRKFAAVNLRGNIPSPTIEGRVTNQNLHALPQQDLVIIAHSDFVALAETLAEAHRQKDSIKVVVVTPEQVYNEFSSGTPDATAYRRFMKMFYDRAQNTDELPQSLLLFGDGVYDNRLLTSSFSGSSAKPNKLLVYESVESLEGTSSYVTDDYFGFLDDTEGANLAKAKLDIGIGRFPVRNQVEAKTVVNKALNYMENKDKGVWKNTLCFLGDDGDNNIHVTHADNLAETVRASHPEFIINKIYVDAYERVTTASGTTVPSANQRFSELLTSGLLMLNYSGHGSTTAWAVESLLSITEIKNMYNTRLPLWVTATCDFCRYDDAETSGGEYVFLNENGGAIAMFTTSRVVYSSPNFVLNKAFVSNVFSKQNGSRLSLGEVMCKTKQSSTLSSDRNKLNFALIGDPALTLSYPAYSAKITEINGHAVNQDLPDTVTALSTVRMAGQIYRYDGTLAEDFNGMLYPTVFDAEETCETLGNSGNDVFSYQDRTKALFSGKAAVEKGTFSFTFAVPKDISYSYQNGQVNLYAYSSDDDIEAQGVFEDFLIGGTNEDAVMDTLGPEICLFMNDTTFVSGGKVNETPTLIALVSDADGLNTGGNSIGHDITLTIDGENKYVLNNYYESDVNSYTSGNIYYNLPELSEGSHSVTLKAWDMQNNSSTASLRFNVVKGYAPAIQSIGFFQNEEKAWFSFTHNRPEMWMTADLRVYDIWGRLQWQTSVNMINGNNASENIEWDYTGNSGRKVENGVYICRLYISVGNDETAVLAKKIMVGVQ